MKICENGIIREMIAEEIAALEAAREAEQEAEKHRPPTADERLEALEAALLEMIMEENT